MKYRTTIGLIICFLTLPGYVNADPQGAPKKGDVRNSKVIDSSRTLTDQERSLAKDWLLTEEDWIKYKEIMAGPRGIWSPGLDPITALGVSETDPLERQRYAEIWMKMEVRRTELELAFERARAEAGQRMFPAALAIDNRHWIEDYNKKRFTRTKRILFFTRTDCVEDCKDFYQEVRGSVDNRTRLDIYLTDTESREDVSTWAKSLSIDPAEVKQKIVTLNFDKGVSSKVGIRTDELPKAMVLFPDGTMRPYR